MNKSKYPVGIDCVWVARDSDGFLAAFITAGAGPIPNDILEGGNDVIQAIEEKLFEFLPVTSAQLHVQVPRPDDFISFAERGFFVYDWRECGSCSPGNDMCYVRVASPKVPIIESKYFFYTIDLSAVHSDEVSFLRSQYLDYGVFDGIFSYPDG